MRRKLAEWPWNHLDYTCGSYAEVRVITLWPVLARTEATTNLLSGLASLKVALPTPAESAVAATAVDDGLAANEEVGDAL